MKTSILIAALVCALSHQMELTEAVRPEKLVELLNQVEHESFVFDEQESTFTIADLFFEIRESRKTFGARYAQYEQDLQRAKNYLVRRHTWLYIDAHFLRLMDFIPSLTKADIGFWSSLVEDFSGSPLSIQEVDKFYDLRTNQMLAEIFQSAFKERLLNPELDPGSIIKAVINGSGFCNLFKHPSDDSSRDIDASNESLVKLAKLGYLLNVIRTQNIGLKVNGNSSPTLAVGVFNSLAALCNNLVRVPLDDKKRKQFLASMLSLNLEFSNIILPMRNSKILRVNFCSRLEQLMQRTNEFGRRFKLLQTRGIFIEECLDDIAVWPQVICEDGDGRELDRWQDTILQFAVEGNADIANIFVQVEHLKIDLHPTFNDEFDKVLKGLITQYPTTGSKLAYESGEGLCNALYEDRCNENYKMLWRILLYLPPFSLERLFVNIPKLNEQLLCRFFLMRLVCNNIRQTIDISLRQQIAYANKYIKLEYDKPHWQIFKASLLDRWIKRISQFVSHEAQSNMNTIIAIFSSNLDDSALLNAKLNPKYSKYLQLLVDELPASEAVLAFKAGEGICKDLLGVKIFVRLLRVFERIHEIWSSGQVMDIFYSQSNRELIDFGLVIKTCYFLQADYPRVELMDD